MAYLIHCNVLQCVVVCRSVSQCVAVCYSVLQRVAVSQNTLLLLDKVLQL